MAESNSTKTSTDALVRQTRSGDEQAARVLLEQLYPLVLRLVRSHQARRTSEEDLCQMIFVRIFQRLDQYAGIAPLEHWVSRIAINTCLNQIEAERIRPELRYADLGEEQAEAVEKLTSSTAELPEQNRSAARELVGQLLAQLEPRDRLIITLLHLEERSVAEIKALTGWNTAVIKVRAFRARQRLKRLYAQLLPDEK